MIWFSQHHSSFWIVAGLEEGLAPGNDKGLWNKVCTISACNLTFPEGNTYKQLLATNYNRSWSNLAFTAKQLSIYIKG